MIVVVSMSVASRAENRLCKDRRLLRLALDHQVEVENKYLRDRKAHNDLAIDDCRMLPELLINVILMSDDGDG